MIVMCTGLEETLVLIKQFSLQNFCSKSIVRFNLRHLGSPSPYSSKLHKYSPKTDMRPFNPLKRRTLSARDADRSIPR
jgi:hypothetical protein